MKNWKEELKSIFESREYENSFYHKRLSDRRLNDSLMHLIEYLFINGSTKEIQTKKFNIVFNEVNNLPDYIVGYVVIRLNPLKIDEILNFKELKLETFRLRKILGKLYSFYPDEIEINNYTDHELQYICKYGSLQELQKQMILDGFMTVDKIGTTFCPTDIAKVIVNNKDNRWRWNTYFMSLKYSSFCKNFIIEPELVMKRRVKLLMNRIDHEI